MKARMKEELMELIDGFFKGKEGHRTDENFIQLCDRIAGKEVELVFIGQDAFEKEDKNYWLPDCCWDEINL
jgi:hypothetical protein